MWLHCCTFDVVCKDTKACYNWALIESLPLDVESSVHVKLWRNESLETKMVVLSNHTQEHKDHFYTRAWGPLTHDIQIMWSFEKPKMVQVSSKVLGIKEIRMEG